MGLGTYLRELITPGRYIPNAERFNERYLDDVLKNKDIQELLEKSGERREGLEKKLEFMMTDKYNQLGKNHFEKKKYVSNLLRYGSLAAYGIGTVAAAGGLLTLLATGGAALAAIPAGILVGVKMNLLGAGISSAADVYDAAQLGKSLQQKKPEEKPKGFLGYLKKAAKGVWEYAKSPFIGAYKGAKAIAEGALWKGTQIFGPYLTGLLKTNPYLQIGTMGAGYVDFYRGRKKFDDRLIKEIKNKTIEDFINYANKTEEYKQPVRALKPVKGNYETQMMYQDTSNDNVVYLNKVKPRHAASKAA